MNPDPASLENLRDIAEPPPVSWLPLAPGWWFVCALVLVVAAYFSFRIWRSWRANAYRRAALDELAAASDISTIAEILKRTALASYPRADVAALTGAAWYEWLEKTGGQRMSDQVCAALIGGVFGASSTMSQQEVTAFTSAWISNHLAHDLIDSRVEQYTKSSSESHAEGEIPC